MNPLLLAGLMILPMFLGVGAVRLTFVLLDKIKESRGA